jgi:hypothetical protein
VFAPFLPRGSCLLRASRRAGLSRDRSYRAGVVPRPVCYVSRRRPGEAGEGAPGGRLGVVPPPAPLLGWSAYALFAVYPPLVWFLLKKCL